MTSQNRNDLWRDFPKTATEFEARFATEDNCRAYLIQARWGGEPACARCESKRVWTIREGTTFECADCGHQTSLTSGTVLEKTRKPLKMWFRAIFEISTRRTGISGKDLQRIMGFGSYETAWTWLHKLRSAMVRSDSEPMGPFVQADEALVGERAVRTRNWCWWPPRPTEGCASPTSRTMTRAPASASCPARSRPTRTS